MTRITDIEERVGVWTKGCVAGGFGLNSGYYTGRGPSTSDINTKVLEGIYDGLKAEVSPQAAHNFVRLVDGLKDMSATLFILAFERFYRNGCKVIDTRQDPKDRDDIRTYGTEAEAQDFTVFARNFTRDAESQESIEQQSAVLKREFLLNHHHEVAA